LNDKKDDEFDSVFPFRLSLGNSEQGGKEDFLGSDDGDGEELYEQNNNSVWSKKIQNLSLFDKPLST